MSRFEQELNEVRKTLGVEPVYKAKGGFPVGTTKMRADGKTYQKQADGKWRLKEGKSADDARASSPLAIQSVNNGKEFRATVQGEPVQTLRFGNITPRKELAYFNRPSAGEVIDAAKAKGLFKPAQHDEHDWNAKEFRSNAQYRATARKTGNTTNESYGTDTMRWAQQSENARAKAKGYNPPNWATRPIKPSGPLK